MERETSINQESKFALPEPEQARLILEQFGEQGLLSIYGLENVGRVEGVGKGISIVCPYSDPRNPGRYINMLPDINWNKVVELFGSEEAAIEGLHRKLGYKGHVRFSKGPGGKIDGVQTSLADVVRTMPRSGRVMLMGLMAAVAAGVL